MENFLAFHERRYELYRRKVEDKGEIHATCTCIARKTVGDTIVQSVVVVVGKGYIQALRVVAGDRAGRH